VYDIDEANGRWYLSMEYIDGETLASLLNRIGRLPSEKVLEVARQLCAGVAAAHDQAILHRDLKPANIMIDGRGHVRITDFGLAVTAQSNTKGEIAGTPAYMAPEQFVGGPVTSRRTSLRSV
jgi:eukaryotic-like serine/threonine-protein kinase